MARRIGLFRLFGIQVSLNYTWFIIFALITWTLAVRYFPSTYPGLSAAMYWLIGALAALLLFASVLFHEFSHSLVAKRSGLPITGITLFIFGGVAQMGEEVKDPRIELKMALAGPAASVMLAIAFGALSVLMHLTIGRSPITAVLTYVAMLNLVLTLFNLVPGFPLDGGRVLRALLWMRTNDIRRATRIASMIGQGFAIVLIFLGVVSFLGGNLVNGVWLVLIGFFLKQAAELGYRQVMVRRSLMGMRVRELMTTEVVSVDSTLSLERLAHEYFLGHRYSSFPVMEGGRVVGMVGLEEMKRVARELWPTVRVVDIMRPLDPDGFAHPDEDAAHALVRMLRGDLGRFPVVEDGRLVGILTRRDLMQLLRIRTDLGE